MKIGPRSRESKPAQSADMILMGMRERTASNRSAAIDPLARDNSPRRCADLIPTSSRMIWPAALTPRLVRPFSPKPPSSRSASWRRPRDRNEPSRLDANARARSCAQRHRVRLLEMEIEIGAGDGRQFDPRRAALIDHAFHEAIETLVIRSDRWRNPRRGSISWRSRAVSRPACSERRPPGRVHGHDNGQPPPPSGPEPARGCLAK